MSAKREKTKANIKNAYITLLAKKDPLDITVTDICNFCKINRSTFYEYYSYIDLLINDVILDQIEDISLYLYDEYYLENASSLERISKYITKIINNRVLMKMINCSEMNYFKAAITRAQTEYEIKRFNITDQRRKWQILYRSSGVLTIIFRWIENRLQPSLNEISSILFEEIRKTETYN